MSDELCCCSQKMLDPADCTYVYHGRPCCSRACYNRAEADYERKQRARAAQAARDVAPGQSWAFTEHRTLAEVGRRVPRYADI
jgi:hypothetical protein